MSAPGAVECLPFVDLPESAMFFTMRNRSLSRVTALLVTGCGFLCAGCTEEISSYHTSRMNGLAHAAELSASDAKRTADDMAVSGEQLESQLETIKQSTIQAETNSGRIRGTAPVRKAPSKSPVKKPVKSSIIKSNTTAH